jgi:hypothetical protein
MEKDQSGRNRTIIVQRRFKRVIDDFYDNAYWNYISYLSRDEREALKALFVGTPGNHLTAEWALLRVERHELPVGLTRRALDAYDRLAEAKIRSGQDTVIVTVNRQKFGQQAFRRQLIAKAFRICGR